ncbi:MAG: hypothetical protein MZV70_70435 [Desulfobacterales bacterium]|nr:hypothetical protein [Desulfobacterales bacterium]
MANLPVTQFYQRRRRQRDALLQRLRRHPGQQHAGRPVAHHQRRTASPTPTGSSPSAATASSRAVDPDGPEHRLRRVAVRRPRALRPRERRDRSTSSRRPRRARRRYRWNWDSPLFISPHSHTRLYFAANKRLPQRRPRRLAGRSISDDLTRQLDRNQLAGDGQGLARRRRGQERLDLALRQHRRPRRVAARRRACSTPAPTTASSR